MSDRGRTPARGPGRSPLRVLALLALATLVPAAPLPASVQQAPEARAKPPAADTVADPPFPPPLASPLEPRTRLAPVRVDRPDRRRWVALVNLGESFPFRLWTPESAGDSTDGGPAALWGELAGGAFSRFDLEGHGNEFVEVHYRVGLRLRARWRGVDARLALHHVSSHLGDEFLERTGRSPISTSREGVELLLGARPLPDLRLYGGPGLLLRSTAGLDPGSFRLGAEWGRDAGRPGGSGPYAAAELFAWEEHGWEPVLALEAGLAFGGRYRLALIAGAGPSRAEQFFRQDETLWGLSLGADL